MVNRCEGVPLAEQAGSLIELLDRELRRDEAARYRAAPLTPVQFSIAQALAEGSLTLGGLAQAICCVPANVTALVDRLERKGYVVRAGTAGDRRVTRVALTTAGRRALDETATLVSGRYEQLSTALSHEELRALVGVLGPLYVELSGGAAGCAKGACDRGPEELVTAGTRAAQEES